MAADSAGIRPDLDFQTFLSQGKFMIQRSRSTGGYVFYPRVAEPGTGARDLDWVAASGKGTVHSVTVIAKRDPADNYNVALIDLAEGPRMMSRVEGIRPEEVAIGMAVTAKIITEGDKPLVVFVPAQGNGHGA